MRIEAVIEGTGGWGQHFPLPVPFNPGSRPFWPAPASLCFFHEKYCATVCVFLLFLPLPATLGLLLKASFFLPSRTLSVYVSPGYPSPLFPVTTDPGQIIGRRRRFHGREIMRESLVNIRSCPFRDFEIFVPSRLPALGYPSLMAFELSLTRH